MKLSIQWQWQQATRSDLPASQNYGMVKVKQMGKRLRKSCSCFKDKRTPDLSPDVLFACPLSRSDHKPIYLEAQSFFVSYHRAGIYVQLFSYVLDCLTVCKI